MVALDMRTVVFSFVLINIVSTVVIIFLWSQYRRRYDGIIYLVAGFLLQLIAYIFIILRGQIPMILSIDIANGISLAGIFAGYIGFQKYTGKTYSNLPSYIILAILGTAHITLSYIFPDPTARYLIISAGYFYFFGQCAWYLIRGVTREMASLTRLTGFVFIGLALLAAVKVIDFLFTGDQPVDYFQSGSLEAVIMIVYQMLVILLTVSIALMFNNNLLRDITAEEEKFTTTFHTTPNAIVLSSFPEGRILEVNEGFTDFSGYKPEDTIGKTTRDLRLWKDDAIRIETINELDKTGMINKREIQFRRKSGEIITGLFSAKVISLTSKKRLITTLYDISERKKNEKELIRSKERAEESDRLKTAFLHNISHEIRTPMNAIVGFANLLSEPGLSDEDKESYIGIILKSSNHLCSIVNDVVEIANIEAGRMNLSVSEVDPGNLLNDLYRQFGPKATEKNLGFILDDPGYVKSIHTDGTKLTQIISNLLSNSFKFTLEGSVKFGYSGKDGELEFYVADTGIGIDSSLQNRIFERFYQVDNTVTRQHEGTGIGLSISKAYSELLGGKIWLESTPGKGSVFYFTIHDLS
jgi:PAS domain S-box-containing protein